MNLQSFSATNIKRIAHYPPNEVVLSENNLCTDLSPSIPPMSVPLSSDGNTEDNSSCVHISDNNKRIRLDQFNEKECTSEYSNSEESDTQETQFLNSQESEISLYYSNQSSPRDITVITEESRQYTDVC